jgi:hypothetical protein
MSKSKSNIATVPMLIEAENLSVAWAKILLRIIDHPGTEIAPLVVSLTGFDEDNAVAEDAAFRTKLDELLEVNGKSSIENVGFTIFPERYWEISGGNRERLFDLYKKSFGRMKARYPSKNGRGLYFQRLMMYGRGPCDGNQLEWIISQYTARTGVRRSMLQASIFDPSKDHVATAQLGFPCLQHVSFEPTSAGLVVNAFYATQQIFDKAYGNYLGLTHLGKFMAHELGIDLERVNIFVGVAKLERITKNDQGLNGLVTEARSLVTESESKFQPMNLLERA